MYEIDVIRFTIERDGVEQEFTLEDYNFKNEVFLSDYMDFMSEEIVTKVSLMIFHNRDVKQLKIHLKDYSAIKLS